MTEHPIRVNLNDVCEVVLQERGVEAIRRYYGRLGMTPPDYEVGDVFRTQLWEVMLIMGRACSMGPEPPFETEITLRPTGSAVLDAKRRGEVPPKPEGPRAEEVRRGGGKRIADLGYHDG